MASHIKVPPGGQKIVPGQAIPDNPIIPFIEGDGIGIDITPVMIKVIDAAVDKAYGGKKKIHWMEVYAGEKSDPPLRPGRMVPEGNLRCPEGVLGVDQGPDDDAGRGRHPLAERCGCARNSTSTSASVRFSTSRACRHR